MDLICSINLVLILRSRAIVLAKLEMIARDVRARARVCHRFITRADNLR